MSTSFVGSEANVAISLSNLGEDVSYLSIVPENVLGRAAKRQLNQYGVHTEHMKNVPGRLGTFYTEKGANFLSGLVVYDREYSCMALADKGSIEWEKSLEGVDWLHVSGITLAISQAAANLMLEGMQVAKKRGITISLDLNYRAKMWGYGKEVKEIMEEAMQLSDVVMGSVAEYRMCLGINIEDSMDLFSEERSKLLGKIVKERYKNIESIVIFLQKNQGVEDNTLATAVYEEGNVYISKPYCVKHIVDRMGIGDSMAAGFIYAKRNYTENQKRADFTSACGVLKCCIRGDYNLVSVEEVDSVLDKENGGDVRR